MGTIRNDWLFERPNSSCWAFADRLSMLQSLSNAYQRVAEVKMNQAHVSGWTLAQKPAKEAGFKAWNAFKLSSPKYSFFYEQWKSQPKFLLDFVHQLRSNLRVFDRRAEVLLRFDWFNSYQSIPWTLGRSKKISGTLISMNSKTLPAFLFDRGRNFTKTTYRTLTVTDTLKIHIIPTQMRFSKFSNFDLRNVLHLHFASKSQIRRWSFSLYSQVSFYTTIEVCNAFLLRSPLQFVSWWVLENHVFFWQKSYKNFKIF